MTEKFLASTQYNDYIGTASFDTHDGTDVHNFFKKYCSDCEGYFPVGFEIGRLTPYESDKFIIVFSAAKIADYGETMGEIISSANRESKITLYRFDAIVPINSVPALFKDIDVKAVSKSLKDLDIEIARP